MRSVHLVFSFLSHLDYVFVNTSYEYGHGLLPYSLADAGRVHMEEGVVHEEVEGLLLPGTAGVLVPAEAAQQLDAGPVAGGIVGTGNRTVEFIMHT